MGQGLDERLHLRIVWGRRRRGRGMGYAHGQDAEGDRRYGKTGSQRMTLLFCQVFRTIVYERAAF
jgi:hypothetical protein